MKICRDEDCPACGWPETYTEVEGDQPPFNLVGYGCSHCGWAIGGGST